ncbi:dgd1 suppressor 1 [Artemisia annua]|uniref:Dgd1 suppressor 1 n=1 Tax=Artemisia annua TaxID=35608 RepID=A0A2U1PFJ7_ARTAN|nr:dgd1 suppressor 1 [Artemisia annua]
MLTYHLTIFLSKLYTEVEKARQPTTLSGNKLLASILVNVNAYFFELDASIHSSCGGCRLFFQKISSNFDNKQWTYEEIRVAIAFTYTNLNTLDLYLSPIVSKYRKPTRIAHHWMYYTLGAIGISIFSVWLLRRSSLSHYTDSSVLEAMRCFFSGPERQLIATVNELCKPFEGEEGEPMEQNKPSELLNSLLIKYVGKKCGGNLSDKEMLDIVRSKLKNHFEHPVLNILKVEKLIQGILIQIEKLHVNYDMAKYDLNDFINAHKVKIAIVANIPNIPLYLGVIVIVRAFLKKVSRANRKRKPQSEVLSAIKSRTMEFLKSSETHIEQPDKSSEYLHGLVLCTLDRYYKKIEKYAEATGEWESLELDLIELGKSSHDSAVMLNKQRIINRLDKFYKCSASMPD